MPKTPVQVYLDSRDRSLLDRLASRVGLSRAATLREAVRRWAAELAGEDDRLLDLIGTMDDPTLPPDLSTRHDEYAVTGYPARRKVAERRPPPGATD
jgi:hypothetical protein